jgi:hypothetical protein
MELACAECGCAAHYSFRDVQFRETAALCPAPRAAVDAFDRRARARSDLRPMIVLTPAFECRVCRAVDSWELTDHSCAQLLGRLLSRADDSPAMRVTLAHGSRRSGSAH